MAIQTPDINAVVYGYLSQTGTELYTLVGTRIAPGQLDDDRTATQCAIVFDVFGGDVDRRKPLHHPRVRFRCFGNDGSLTKAQEVYRALHDLAHGAMDQTVSGQGFIVSSNEASIGRPVNDPDTSEWYIVTEYEMEIRPL